MTPDCHHSLLYYYRDIPLPSFTSFLLCFVRVSDVFLSILPCWHIFERTAEYWCLARGSQMVYSNLRNFKSDLMVRISCTVQYCTLRYTTVQCSTADKCDRHTHLFTFHYRSLSFSRFDVHIDFT